MSSPIHTDLELLLPHLRRVLAPAADTLVAGMPGGERVAAVLAPLYARDGQPHLLFTRRASTLQSHRGEISFPGGSQELTDRSLAETALREAQEEIGLAPARVELLGRLEPVVTVVSNFTIIPFVGFLPTGTGPLRPNPQEVADIIEAPLAALADPAIFHAEEWIRLGQPHTVYFYDYGSNRIWGATARMLFDLLGRLRAGDDLPRPGSGAAG